MQRRQLIGAAATAGSVTIAPALLTGCAAAPKSEPAATVATLPEGASAHVTAVAPTGAYRGCVLDGTGVRRWLGIPFIKNPYEPVRRYLKPEPYGAHEGVMDCLKQNTTQIRNIRQYLLTALFNAPSTMNSYYTALVAHDMAA